MGKKKFSIREEHNRHLDFLATTKRRVTEFLNADERAKRTCSRSWEANVFLDKIIEMADKAEAEGKMITAVIDREGDQVNADSSLRKRVRDPDGKILPGDEFYHHRRSLQRDGISDDEIRQREIFDRQLRKSWRK